MGSIGLIGFQSYLKYGFRDRVNKVYMLNITPYILSGKFAEPKQLICCRHLYVLYNNYIYNVYKDGKYRLEGGA